MSHIPVLLQEVVEGLAPARGDVVLDATVGGGGHSEALCRAMGGRGIFICLDEDESAIARSKVRLKNCGCAFHFARKNFRQLNEALAHLGISEINRALFDLGMSSHQLEESGRGFSFQKDEPLVMSFTDSPKQDAPTAEVIVNKWDEENIEAILLGYGEEINAKRIARAIVKAREEKPIKSSRELALIIEHSVRRSGRIHPATKTFQALRITVNDEIRALSEAMPIAFERLAKRGRMAIISFHSLEDRLVKRFFKELAAAQNAILVTKKPITAGESEQEENPRARSAKLRIIEKV
jgi:16S rRNA (cytosine1402-N4)-methyltransferase